MKRLIAAVLFTSTLAFAAGDAVGDDAKKEKPAEKEKPALDLSKMPFTQESVQTVVRYHLDKIQGCYNDLLAQQGQKTPEGKIVAHWSITTEGIVKGAKIVKKGTTLKDPKLQECVVAAILAMEFPKPGKEQPIDYPFHLKAEK